MRACDCGCSGGDQSFEVLKPGTSPGCHRGGSSDGVDEKVPVLLGI